MGSAPNTGETGVGGDRQSLVGVGGKKVMKGTPRDEVALRPGRGVL